MTTTCPSLFKTGPNKGKACGKPAKFGLFCGVHKANTSVDNEAKTQPEPKDTPPLLEEENEPKNTPVQQQQEGDNPQEQPSRFGIEYPPQFSFMQGEGSTMSVTKGTWNVLKMLGSSDTALFDILSVLSPRGITYVVVGAGVSLPCSKQEHTNLAKREATRIIRSLMVSPEP